MASKYTELYRIPPNLFIPGSPIYIEVGVLQKDITNENVLIQLKFRNISSKVITALKVSIRAFEPNGNEVEGIKNFSYLDLKIGTGVDFGSKTPIHMLDNTTRRFSVAVTEVVFNDNTVWKSEIIEWKELPRQKKIEDVLGDRDIVKQYQIEIGKKAFFYPECDNGVFLCTCGTINTEGCNCYKCGKSYSELLNKLDSKYLAEKLCERVAREAEKEEQERLKIERERIEREKEEEIYRAARLKEKKRKKRKIITIGILVCIALLIGAWGVTKKKQTNELLNAIEMSFYNRVYIDADMDELEKINIQLNELEEFRDTHQITFADKELKEEYENIIDILIDQADLYDQIINLDFSLKESSDLEVYEELIINYYKSMYELSESAVCLIDDYEMCSDNPELVERSRTNKSIFFAYAQMWQYINDISQEDRKKIFDDEGIEFENKCEYDIELYVYPRDPEDLSLLLDSFEMTIESGEKVTLSKSIESRTMGSNSFIQMDIVLKNPRG